MNSSLALGEYRRYGVENSVESATPHRLIQMLMSGALQKIAIAREAIERQDAALKGQQISWAISIIDGLRVSLDKSIPGGVAENLDDLYEYMNRRLFEANIRNDTRYLDEVAGLMQEIKEGWDAIPEEIILDHANKVTND